MLRILLVQTIGRLSLRETVVLLDEGFRDVLPVLFDFLGVGIPAAAADEWMVEVPGIEPGSAA